MQSARRFFTFVSGIALYTSAMVASNVLSTIPLPRSWLLVSGRSDTLMAQAWKAALLALPLLVLAAVWVHITLRARQRSRKHVVAWMFGGLLTGWLGWLMYGFIVFAVQTGERTWPVASMLFSSQLPPLWGVLNTVGIFVGAVIGLWTVPERVSTRQQQRAVGSPPAANAAMAASSTAASGHGPRIPRLSNWRKPAAPRAEAASLPQEKVAQP